MLKVSITCVLGGRKENLNMSQHDDILILDTLYTNIKVLA